MHNPIQKDSVVFLKTSEDTGGACTLVKVEPANGGGAGLHDYKTYSESFECLYGFPKARLVHAWLFDISENNLPGRMNLFEFILRRQAKSAGKKGLDRKLAEQYVKF